MAAAHPEGTFLGTDAAAAPLADAAALAAELGLANVAFRAQTFEQTLADPPQGFDYVAAFGVLAWVDSANRMRVLDLARRMLRPGGALVLAYNALPGWSPDLIAQRLLHGWYRRAEGRPRHGSRWPFVALARLPQPARVGWTGLGLRPWPTGSRSGISASSRTSGCRTTGHRLPRPTCWSRLRAVACISPLRCGPSTTGWIFS
jgi:SAM-dependent methyltransferase